MDFLRNNKRFDFLYGGKNIWEFPYTTEVIEDGSNLTTVYTFEDGLKVTNIAKKIEKHGAYEWVNYFENTGDKPTEVLSEVFDAKFDLDFPPFVGRAATAYITEPEFATKIYAPTGSRSGGYEFYTDVNKVECNNRFSYFRRLNSTRKFCSGTGRSSENRAPFFNVHQQNMGVIFAIGWSANWRCDIRRNTDSITVFTGVQDANFKILPGEKFRTSSIVVMPYTGSVNDSQNKWRRLVKEEYCLIGKEGRDQHGPLTSNIWGGMTSDKCIETINEIAKYKLPADYIWMDAGWYGKNSEPTPDEFTPGWYDHTGDWSVCPKTHPNELMDVSKAIHDAGYKFLLWFEPERVIRNTPISLEHPEYFIDIDEKSNDLLLNLGNEEAWQYCFDTISSLIEKIGVDFYRQDFNFDPLPYFRFADTEDRRGITEIKHVNGLYRFWDALLEKFPHLMIDDCAAGGRRIDIETYRRSTPLWRSDTQCIANPPGEYTQLHTLTYNTWLPYTGTSTGRVRDVYGMRSSYASSLATNHLFNSGDTLVGNSEKMLLLKSYMEEYLKVRPYFSEDFYPLTNPSTDLSTWSAEQFDRPSEKDGIVLCYRREEAPYPTAVFMLSGIDKTKKYRIYDIDGNEDYVIDGKKLCEEGFTVTLPEKKSSRIYFYKAK